MAIASHNSSNGSISWKRPGGNMRVSLGDFLSILSLTSLFFGLKYVLAERKNVFSFNPYEIL